MKNNVSSTFVSQAYVVLVSIVMVPLYLKYMGEESYGLIGLFSTLQIAFGLLDLGLTQTIVRETARFNGGAISAMDYRHLANMIEKILFWIAFLFGILFFTLASISTKDWLNANHLSSTEVKVALQLIVLIVIVRWMSGFYRGIVSGAERLVWLGGFNIVVATMRFILILPILIYVSKSPIAFFIFQLIIGVIEISCLIFMAYRILPDVSFKEHKKSNSSYQGAVVKFSLSIAVTSSMWVLATQMDKFLLPAILPLAEYGYFTIAVMVANGIILVSSPVAVVIMPRLSKLQAEGQYNKQIEIYRYYTQFVTLAIVPLSLMLVFFPRELLWAWSGDRRLVEITAVTLRLYAIGYVLMALGSFQYYIQYAKGDLRLHIMGTIFFMVILIPSVIYGATNYGMEGAAWGWLITNTISFIFWVPVVHHKFLPGLHKDWLLVDIIYPVLLPIGLCLIGNEIIPWSKSRSPLIFQLALFLTVLLVITYPLTRRLKLLKLETLFFRIFRKC